jgi:hypothetical protein
MISFPSTQTVNGTLAASSSTAAAGQSMGISFSQSQHQPMILPKPSYIAPQILPRDQMIKHRSGKWTLEEEDYAAILIEMFLRRVKFPMKRMG